MRITEPWDPLGTYFVKDTVDDLFAGEKQVATKTRIIEDINELFSDESFSLDEALTNMQEIKDVVNANIDALDEDIGERDMG